MCYHIYSVRTSESQMDEFLEKETYCPELARTIPIMEHPRPRRRPHRLRALAQGGDHPHPGAGRHHQGQRLHPDRRSTLCQDRGAIQHVVRGGEPHLHGHPAHADHHEERAGQDHPRQDLRGEGHAQLQHRQGHQRGRLRLGTPVPPLRDQGHISSGGGEEGHGDAGRGRTQKARSSSLKLLPDVDKCCFVLSGAMINEANRAKGAAEAILARADATARGIKMVSESFKTEGAIEAASLRIAEQYIQAFSLLAKNSNTMLLPSDAGNPGAMIAQSLQIFKHTRQSNLMVPGGQQQAAEEVLAADLGVPSLGNILPNQK